LGDHGVIAYHRFGADHSAVISTLLNSRPRSPEEALSVRTECFMASERISGWPCRVLSSAPPGTGFMADGVAGGLGECCRSTVNDARAGSCHLFKAIT